MVNQVVVPHRKTCLNNSYTLAKHVGTRSSTVVAPATNQRHERTQRNLQNHVESPHMIPKKLAFTPILLTLLLPIWVLALEPYNTSTTTQDGSLIISGLSSRAYHDIEGAALLGQARFSIENSGTTPVSLSVLEVEFLANRECREVPISQTPPQLLAFRRIQSESTGSTDVSVHNPTILINLRAPSLVSSKAQRGPDAERTSVREHRTAAATPPEARIGARSHFDRERLPTDSQEFVTVQPQTTVNISVSFSPVEAFYSRCARHAFQVTFVAKDEELKAIAETSVARLEQFRQR